MPESGGKCEVIFIREKSKSVHHVISTIIIIKTSALFIAPLQMLLLYSPPFIILQVYDFVLFLGMVMKIAYFEAILLHALLAIRLLHFEHKR